mmetsp:Transcript_44553/g.74346  ORF Transcript_44553/g.74346 Transcript_44553/m.74346 type:complete len:206 (+) Transcript_44553:1064-1681(+)
MHIHLSGNHRALRGCPLDGLGVYKRGDRVVAGERCYEGHLVLAPGPHHCLHSPLNAPRRCRFPPSRPHEALEFGRVDALLAQVAMSVTGAEESDGRCACHHALQAGSPNVAGRRVQFVRRNNSRVWAPVDVVIVQQDAHNIGTRYCGRPRDGVRPVHMVHHLPHHRLARTIRCDEHLELVASDPPSVMFAIHGLDCESVALAGSA